MSFNQEHICLVIHCLKRKSSPPFLAHKELFIQLKDVEKMIRTLRQAGYKFVLPMNIKESDGPTCSLTFDDGYFNNSYFLELAEKYNTPFILFLTSYNIVSQTPFIWDIWEATRGNKLRMSYLINYRKLYEKLRPEEKDLLKNENHRPYTMDELKIFASHPLAYLAPHTHTHQPIIGKYITNMDSELQENISFLNFFSGTLVDDFSLPCGLYTSSTKKRLLDRFKRIYTIDGGGFSPSDRVINRISLINPDVGGDLMAQIEKSFQRKSRLLRKIANIRYSNSLFSRI